MDNKQKTTRETKEVYVAPKAEIMTVELDQSILQTAASLPNKIDESDGVFTPIS